MGATDDSHTREWSSAYSAICARFQLVPHLAKGPQRPGPHAPQAGFGVDGAAPARGGRNGAGAAGLEFLTGELQGSHDPSGVVFTVLSGMEREYIRDRTLEGHESARTRGKATGGAAVTDDAMLAVALHLRGQELSLRDIAARLVIATGKKKGQHPPGHRPAHAPRARRTDRDLRPHTTLPPVTSRTTYRSATWRLGSRSGGGWQNVAEVIHLLEAVPA